MIVILFAGKANSQEKKINGKEVHYQTGLNETGNIVDDRYPDVNDSLQLYKGICKNNRLFITPFVLPMPDRIKFPEENSESFLKLHGNILYNFSYRSYIDTPFAQADLIQHLVQTNLNFLVKDKYPVKMIITSRSSNSSYFKNYVDVNLQFSQRQMLNSIKADMLAGADSIFNNRNMLISSLHDLQLQYKQLQYWLNSPVVIQQLVEEKEQRLSDSLANVRIKKKVKDSIKNKADSTFKINNWGDLPDSLDILSKAGANSLYKTGDFSFLKRKKEGVDNWVDSNNTGLKATDSSVKEKYNERKKQLEALKDKIKEAEINVKSAEKKIRDSVNKMNNEIHRVNNTDSLYAFMKRNKIPDEKLTKAQRLLLSVNQIGIGRTWVDYSELTVKNISLSGLNMEVNPGHFYFALAAGSVNYRFRDFIYKTGTSFPNQSLYLIRAGIRKKELDNIIVTVYNGKKQVFNPSLSDSSSQALQNLIGISVEGQLYLNKNNYLTGEVAKSSYFKNPAEVQSNAGLISKVLDFGTHTNEAYCVKLFSDNPSTNTKLTAFYKKAGQYFQSFNLYPINVSQDAWMVKVNQKLWKKQLLLEASIRQNGFENPLAVLSISNKTVFKSFLASLKIPKYPFLSVGFYPSSQLTLTNGNILQENQYNTLNIVSNYSYRLNKTAMNSNVVFTKFYNSSNDTGFIYFNASSLIVAQQVFFSQFSLTTSLGIINQKALSLFTLEQQLSYRMNKNISLTGGLKWNELNHTKTLFGANTAVEIFINKLGMFQFQYEKAYLPGSGALLIPVDMGRMSFYREF